VWDVDLRLMADCALVRVGRGRGAQPRVSERGGGGSQLQIERELRRRREQIADRAYWPGRSVLRRQPTGESPVSSVSCRVMVLQLQLLRDTVSLICSLCYMCVCVV